MDGEFHINFWCGGDAWLNQRVAKLGSKGKVSVGLLRFAIERPVRDFNETITGTTVKHLGDKHLKQVRLLIPPAALLDQANEVCESIRRMSVTLALQSRAVAQARNLLLPRLLSGEIAV